MKALEISWAKATHSNDVLGFAFANPDVSASSDRKRDLNLATKIV